MTGDEKRRLLKAQIEQRRQARQPPPLSFAQERLFVLDRLLTGVPLYNIPATIPLDERTDPEVLDRALQEIVSRHEVFRTSFLLADGQPRLNVERRLELTLDVVDVRHLPQDAQSRELRRLAAREAGTPFDLQAAPLARACLVRCRGASFLLWTVHHIISDAWSAEVFVRELRQLCDAFAAGHASPLPALAIQYSDYARLQREQLTSDVLERLLAFWRSRLAGAPELLELPADRPRPKRPAFRGGLVSHRLPPDAVAALFRLGQQERATPFMTLQAAFVLLLHRIAGHTDIVVGTPAANRSRRETEALIGLFVNTLVLRHDVSGAPTFREMLRRVRDTTLAAFDHQELPFERLVEDLQPSRSTAHNPIFQVMFVFQAVPDLPMEGADAPPANGMAKFDLTLFATATDREVLCGWEFSRDLFEEHTIRRFARWYAQLLHQAAADPDAPAVDYALMDDAERRQWSALVTGPSRMPETSPLHRLFDAQADATPDAIAIEASGTVVSYRRLRELADAFAADLIAAGAEPGQPVALVMRRSWQAMAAALAILKTGCAYVPIDPSYPDARVRYMIEHSAARVLVRHSADASAGVLPGCEIVTLDAAPAASEQDLLYIMYTSGSTGTPKGVMMPHAVLANLLSWQRDCEQGRGRRTLQFAPLSFDVSVQEMFSTWTTGGTLVVPDDDVRRDFPRLWQVIVDGSIQRIFLPYVALQALAEAAAADAARAPALELVVTAGEQLLITPAIVTLFSTLVRAELWNQYGPTETHVVTQHVLRGDPSAWPARPPIGRPIANATVLVLDDRGQPAPIGIPGELHVGGVPLARGYWRAPALTAERFFEHPVHGVLYRTGDQARLLNDGTIEFLGRRDDQIKVRGFRVEPGEVRTALLQHRGIGEAAVVPHTLRSGETRLVAYITARDNADIDVAALRDWCAERLPDYMIPMRFVELKTMPLTPSGKIALRALPPLDVPDVAGVEPTPDDLTATESALIDLVTDVLEIPAASPQQDFFSLGGHSLLAMRLLSRIRARFGVDISMPRLFDRPSLRDLAAAIDAETQRIDSQLPFRQASELVRDGAPGPRG